MGYGNVKGFIKRVWKLKELKEKCLYDFFGEGVKLGEI